MAMSVENIFVMGSATVSVAVEVELSARTATSPGTVRRALRYVVYITLRYVTLRYVTLRYVTLRYVT